MQGYIKNFHYLLDISFLLVKSNINVVLKKLIRIKDIISGVGYLYGMRSILNGRDFFLTTVNRKRLKITSFNKYNN